jgi:hypothetical protein
MMSKYRELDEKELEEQRERTGEGEIPRGWRPSQETVEAIQSARDVSVEREWADQGIRDVPLAQVDLRDSPVHDTSDFHKVSREEMVEGFRKLEEEVRPAVERGATGDYFSQLDKEQGLDYEHGYRRVYDAFYGDSCIRLEKVGDSYAVVNGYHRLAVARELGLKTVPAQVIEEIRR